MKRTAVRSSAVVAALALGLAACGSDDNASDDADEAAQPESTEGADESEASSSDDGAEASDGDVPTIAVTTNILGDVVSEVVGDAAEVVTIMPVGADPHDFQASAQEINAMMSADALITNGESFEEGLVDAIENAESEGVPTHEAIDGVETIEFGEGGHDHSDHSDEEHSDEEHSDEEKDEDHDHSDEEHDHSDEEHSDEEHSDEEHDHSDEEHSDEEHSDEEHSDEEHSDEEHDHDHSGADPHFFTDPARMAVAVEGIVAFLQEEVTFADPAAIEATAEAYLEELNALDVEAEEMTSSILEENRVLVTNHEVFGYYADRYDFEVVGAVIPGGSTSDAVSAGEIAELAAVIDEEGVPAIFSDTSASDDLIQTLADEVGDVQVVELYTESLGEDGSPGETYLGMIRFNSEQITEALS